MHCSLSHTSTRASHALAGSSNCANNVHNLVAGLEPPPLISWLLTVCHLLITAAITRLALVTNTLQLPLCIHLILLLSCAAGTFHFIVVSPPASVPAGSSHWPSVVVLGAPCVPAAVCATVQPRHCTRKDVRDPGAGAVTGLVITGCPGAGGFSFTVYGEDICNRKYIHYPEPGSATYGLVNTGCYRAGRFFVSHII